MSTNIYNLGNDTYSVDWNNPGAGGRISDQQHALNVQQAYQQYQSPAHQQYQSPISNFDQFVTDTGATVQAPETFQDYFFNESASDRFDDMFSTGYDPANDTVAFDNATGDYTNLINNDGLVITDAEFGALANGNGISTEELMSNISRADDVEAYLNTLPSDNQGLDPDAIDTLKTLKDKVQSSQAYGTELYTEASAYDARGGRGNALSETITHEDLTTLMNAGIDPATLGTPGGNVENSTITTSANDRTDENWYANLVSQQNAWGNYGNPTASDYYGDTYDKTTAAGKMLSSGPTYVPTGKLDGILGATDDKNLITEYQKSNTKGWGYNPSGPADSWNQESGQGRYQSWLNDFDTNVPYAEDPNMPIGAGAGATKAAGWVNKAGDLAGDPFRIAGNVGGMALDKTGDLLSWIPFGIGERIDSGLDAWGKGLTGLGNRIDQFGNTLGTTLIANPAQAIRGVGQWASGNPAGKYNMKQGGQGMLGSVHDILSAPVHAASDAFEGVQKGLRGLDLSMSAGSGGGGGGGGGGKKQQQQQQTKKNPLLNKGKSPGSSSGSPVSGSFPGQEGGSVGIRNLASNQGAAGNYKNVGGFDLTNRQGAMEYIRANGAPAYHAEIAASNGELQDFSRPQVSGGTGEFDWQGMKGKDVDYRPSWQVAEQNSASGDMGELLTGLHPEIESSLSDAYSLA